MNRREWLGTALSIGGVGAFLPVGLPRPPAGNAADLPLHQLREQLRRGQLSPVDATEAYLARIASVDTALHTFVTVTAEPARARARALARLSPRGRGPLFGVPVAHKDLFETAGVPTGAGSRLFEHHVPARDATVVARLAAAGAVMLGKTNTHELGGGVTTINPFTGTTRNPRDPERIAGGSSGGSAAAVAARLAAAATGSDTGGSVRIPAALCGCVGFKPTYGVLSTAGILGAAPSFDHAGFLARDVADLPPLVAATMGVDAHDPATVPALALGGAQRGTLSGLRVGVPRAYFFEDMDADVERAVGAALTRLARAGAILRDVRAPIDGTTMGRVFDPIAVAEIQQTYERDWREHPSLFSDAFATVFTAPAPTGRELAAAHRERRRFQMEMTLLLDDIDLLAMPTVPIVAPPIAGPIDGARLLRNTWPFNAARMPALSVPCGPRDRLPVGLQLVARPFDDARLLRIAAEAQRVLDDGAR